VDLYCPLKSDGFAEKTTVTAAANGAAMGFDTFIWNPEDKSHIYAP
jgi:hypothetical protein